MWCRPTLPIELLQPIMEHLTGHTHDLLACSTASKACGVEAQRILFRTVIHLDGGHKRTVRFLDSITNSPDRLALHVRVLKLHMTSTFQEPILILIPAAFRLLHNLKHLYFRSYQAKPFAASLRGVTFKLEGLNWGCRMDGKELALNFLPSQPQLKYIHLKDWKPHGLASGVDASMKDLCPSLECIDGPGSVLLALFPNRLEAKVVLWYPLRVEPSGLPAIGTEELTGELGRVECLSYTNVYQGFTLGNITRLTSLRVLELRGYVRSNLDVINELPKLQQLILSKSSSLDGLRACYADRSVEDPKSIEKTFAQSSSLKWIDIQISGEADYMRWCRASLSNQQAERIPRETAQAYRYKYTGIFW